ncbi:MAG: chaperone NapD [Rubripirellula sp.]|nr:chaperone NapD [Rubripirellula sp.]
MPISGLVITFDSPVDQCTEAIDALNAMTEVEIGNQAEHKLAIVVETESKEHDRKIWESVQQLPQVTDVAIAMVAFDEEIARERAPKAGASCTAEQCSIGGSRQHS